MGICLMSPPNLKRIRSKMSERLITLALAHARSHTYAVIEHDKYVSHVTCGHLWYVPIKFEENPSKDN
jgi:hypothetical protein